MLGPIIEELSVELQGKVKVCKVNVDEAQELAAQFNVMSIRHSSSLRMARRLIRL